MDIGVIESGNVGANAARSFAGHRVTVSDSRGPETLRDLVSEIEAARAAGFGEIDLGGLGSSEVIARYLPGTRVVNAFNTMYHETLRAGGRAAGEDRLVLFVAGDDEGAKAVVSRHMGETGFAPVDAGTLAEGREQEPGSPIYNATMTGDEAREALAALG